MRRFGRFADMEHAYSTMDRDFMESVWWVFKELWDKGLIYESYRIMHICPRCETTLSQSEVAEGYKDVKDLAVTAKFKLKNPEKLGLSGDVYVLAWTTTPWTLPGNVALAVGKELDYVVLPLYGEPNEETAKNPLKYKNAGIEKYQKVIVARSRASSILALHPGLKTYKQAPAFYNLSDEEFIEKITEKVFKGEKLRGLQYSPLFDYYAKDESLRDRENGWKIYHADFVTTDMGTGIAHEAPAFGEDDMQLGKANHLPWVQHVNMDGSMKAEVTDFAGRPVKSKEDPSAMDVEIIKYLAKAGTLFAKEKYEHSYPHCWRCDTPLLNYATSSWFVKVTELKPRMLELAKNINWSPEHIKEGRFGKWLEGARDWSISRQRYWASVMPIWKCDCGELRVFGSATELEEASGKKIDDLHKHIVDEVAVPCEKCGGVMRRVPDVLDTWFDSGSMPYAQMHYPFENKEKFESAFPAQFIAEGVDQTRAWFYYQHVIGTGIKDSNAFQNVVVNGIVLAEDGKKMSKKLKNYPDPMEILNKYGSDVLRYYLMASPVVAAENLNFSERDMSDIQRNLFRMLWNSYSFFTTYAVIDNWSPQNRKSKIENRNLLDRWILSELQLLIKEVNAAMEKYELNRATRAFGPFVDNLSNWYIRRSRKRFWKSEDDGDKEQAYQTLYTTLVTLAKLMAPFTPFLAEEIYRNLTGEESVHLAEYPVVDDSLVDEKLNEEMQHARFIVTMGLKFRADNKIKVRQPLQYVKARPINKELEDMVIEELNVKEYISQDEMKELVELDLTITPGLKLEMEAREIIRAIQEGRKKAGFNVEDRISLGYIGKENVFEMFGEMIAKEVLATVVESAELADAEYSETADIEGESFTLSLKRV